MARSLLVLMAAVIFVPVLGQACPEHSTTATPTAHPYCPASVNQTSWWVDDWCATAEQASLPVWQTLGSNWNQPNGFKVPNEQYDKRELSIRKRWKIESASKSGGPIAKVVAEEILCSCKHSRWTRNYTHYQSYYAILCSCERFWRTWFVFWRAQCHYNSY